MKTFKTPIYGGALALLMASSSLVAQADTKHTNMKTVSAKIAARGKISAAQHAINVARNALAWTEWEQVSPLYAGQKKPSTLVFTDRRFQAWAGCNSMGAEYSISGKKLAVKPILSTKMACDAATMRAEYLYSRALQNARGFKISNVEQTLTLYGSQTLTFRLTGRTAPGFAQTNEIKILNVAPQLGAQFDGDKTPKYLQLEDLTEGTSWGRFTEARIEDFYFERGYRYQIRAAVERNSRSGEKQLRLVDIVSQQWTLPVVKGANDKIFEVAPTKVDCVGVVPMKCLQVREVGGNWANFHAPIEGFDFQEGWRYRLQVAVTKIANAPADSSNLRYKLVRLLDKTPVTQ